METNFDNQVKILYQKANKIVDHFLKANSKDTYAKVNIPRDFEEEFYKLVNKVNLSLMEDKDNFFGYFLIQMSREIRFDISSPTAINFTGAKYVIYFNPLIFLTLNIEQMETTIKHEILHILSLHLIRAKELKANYSKLAVNLAMDIVVNTYLDNLPPFSTTLERLNVKYSLKLLPFQAFEYYVEELHNVITIFEEDNEKDNDKKPDNSVSENRDKSETAAEFIQTEYNPEHTHNLWDESSYIDDKTLKEFTEKFIDTSRKGKVPTYVENIITSLKGSKNELPWNLYLKRLMGTIESNKKKTITRRNRRQPERLDLRGQLRSHKARIIVALDISGSISDEEFNQAIKEVLAIVRNYNHEITIVECDSEIRRAYKVKSVKDIKERVNTRGGTKFSPVFEYANKNKVNLLIYFTDGEGEEKLQTKPRGYKTLWVISGRGEKLSLKEPFGPVKKLNYIEIEEDTVELSDLKRDGYSMNDQEGMHI